MILIAEPVHFGDTHVQVNSAFLVLLQSVFIGNEIKFVAEEAQIAAVQANVPETMPDVTFQSFRQYSKPGRFFWFQKIFGEWHQIIRILLLARKEKPELLVWLCLFPTGHLFLQLLNKLFFSGQKQLVILHGEIEYLDARNKKRADKTLGIILSKALKWSDKQTSYIVLGDSIKHTLDNLRIAVQEKIFSFTHPFIYKEGDKQTPATEEPLRVCTFGVLKKSKNAHLFFELAQRFSEEIDKGLLCFNTVGRISPEVRTTQNQWVHTYKPDDFLQQSEFLNKISGQDVALFFYDQSMYTLSASGALHEALNQKLPFISLRNEYFSGVLQTGKVGLCVDSLDEMEQEIRALLVSRKKILSEFHASITGFLQQNSFSFQVEKLKTLLHQSSLIYSRH